MTTAFFRHRIGSDPRHRLVALTGVAAGSLVWVALWHGASLLAITFGISAWYPPAAVSLYLMIRYGLLGAAGIFAAAFAVSLDSASPGPTVHNIAAALAHVAAYGAAAFVYRTAVGASWTSFRPRQIMAFLGAAFLGAALASALGNINHVVEFDGQRALTFDHLLGWMIGDLFGVISICPFLLFFAENQSLRLINGKRLVRQLKAPLAGLAVAMALSVMFAFVAQGTSVHFRLVTVMGVGVASVMLSWIVAPRSALIYLFLIAIAAAAWLSTEVAPAARVEFAVQSVTFLVGCYAMAAVSLERMRHRARALVRRIGLRDLARQRDALSRRIATIEREFAQLAHELKTPLGGMIGMLGLAEEGLAGATAVSGSGRQDRLTLYFRHMRGCALYLNALVDDAFEAARLSRGTIEPVMATVSLGELVEDLAQICSTKTGDRVGFPSVDSIRDVLVWSDRNRLLQILVNLVVNAVRYTDRPDSVCVRCAVAAGMATISVENSAPSVTKQDLDRRIRGDGTLAGNSQGLGIGLPLIGRLSTALRAPLSTSVADGVVTIAVSLEIAQPGVCGADRRRA